MLWNFPSLGFACCFALLALHDPATAPTTSPNLLADRLPQLEADSARLPRRNVDSIRDVVRIERRGDQLIAQSMVTDLAEQTRLMIADTSGFITLALGVASQHPNDDDTRDFTFINDRLTGQYPKISETITRVSFTVGHVMIARDSESAEHVDSVQLICDPPPAPDTGDPTDPPVKLYISRLNNADKQNEVHIRRSANSFRELWLQFPEDVNRYVRPILRDLKAESTVFAPDVHAAWQVLMSDWQPDTAVVQQVAALSVKLDSPDFHERAAAESQIRKLGEPAAIVLSRMDRAKMSPQRQNAVDSILESFFPLRSEEAKKFRDDRNFLLDTLRADDATLRKLAWKRLQIVTQTKLTFDPDADEATRAAAIDKLENEI